MNKELLVKFSLVCLQKLLVKVYSTNLSPLEN